MPQPRMEGPEPIKGGAGAWLTLFAVSLVLALVLIAWALMRGTWLLLVVAAALLVLAVHSWRKIRPLRP